MAKDRMNVLELLRKVAPDPDLDFPRGTGLVPPGCSNRPRSPDPVRQMPGRLLRDPQVL